MSQKGKKKPREFTVKVSGSAPINGSLLIIRAAFLQKDTMAQTQKVQAQVFLDLKRTTSSPFPTKDSEAFLDYFVTKPLLS